MQLSFFIGYNACICYAFFLMLGSISFRVSLVFVRHIYSAVKSEWQHSAICKFVSHAHTLTEQTQESCNMFVTSVMEEIGTFIQKKQPELYVTLSVFLAQYTL